MNGWAKVIRAANIKGRIGLRPQPFGEMVLWQRDYSAQFSYLLNTEIRAPQKPAEMILRQRGTLQSVR
jgi:hypothetical protein